MSVRIYHNPRCSKSRASPSLLEQQPDSIEIIEYLNTPPSVDTLIALCQQLNCQPLDLIRSHEARFKELGLNKNDQRSKEEWCKLMNANPILIERPIIIRNKQTVIGRPPENVLKLYE